jgi:thiosulfate dehydrogenase [quinone] large subunit
MSTESSDPQQKLALTFAALLCRIWLAVRALQTGIEKFAGTKTVGTAVEIDGEVNDVGLETTETVKAYALENYHGVPKALFKQFEGEPLMMGFGLKIYDVVLGPALVILGITILAGIASRVSLMALGLLYISLTWGLILIKQDAGVAWLGTHMILIVAALALHNHNKFCVLKKW